MPLLDVECHPDYEAEARQLESPIGAGITDFVLRHIRDYLWKFADTCPQVTGTNLHIYKPDLSPLIQGEVAAFFTFELVGERRIVLLRGITYSADTEMDEEE